MTPLKQSTPLSASNVAEMQRSTSGLPRTTSTSITVCFRPIGPSKDILYDTHDVKGHSGRIHWRSKPSYATSKINTKSARTGSSAMNIPDSMTKRAQPLLNAFTHPSKELSSFPTLVPA